MGALCPPPKKKKKKTEANLGQAGVQATATGARPTYFYHINFLLINHRLKST